MRIVRSWFCFADCVHCNGADGNRRCGKSRGADRRLCTWLPTWDDAGWHAGDERVAGKMEKVEKKTLEPDGTVTGKTHLIWKGLHEVWSFSFTVTENDKVL